MRIKILAGLIFLTFISCKAQVIKLEIDSNYAGPLLIFIDENFKISDSSSNMSLKNGLGAINEKFIDSKFIFLSTSEKEAIDVIKLGEESKTDSNTRYIFGLTRGFRSSNCLNQDIQTMSGYVGTKMEYIKWRDQYDDEITYFDRNKIDWCAFYKRRL